MRHADSGQFEFSFSLPPVPEAHSPRLGEGMAPPGTGRNMEKGEHTDHETDGLAEDFLAPALRLLSTELAPRVSEPVAKLTGPEEAGRLLVDLIGKKDREHFVVLHLDTRHRVRAVETISVGTLNASLVHPREVFKAAILSNSHAIICGHNHPSAELDPSADDLAIHQRLKEAGQLLGIEVLDFLVVSATDYRSFAMRP
jgi:DNA repair protein RadC